MSSAQRALQMQTEKSAIAALQERVKERSRDRERKSQQQIIKMVKYVTLTQIPRESNKNLLWDGHHSLFILSFCYIVICCCIQTLDLYFPL